jgi:hypothetical protein
MKLVVWADPSQHRLRPSSNAPVTRIARGNVRDILAVHIPAAEHAFVFILSSQEGAVKKIVICSRRYLVEEIIRQFGS